MKLPAKITRKYYKYVTVDTPFVRPNLSNYGTMGGDSFACACSSVYSSSYGWKSVDGNSGTNWETAMYVHNGTLTIQESTEDDYDFYVDVKDFSAVVNNNKLYALDR